MSDEITDLEPQKRSLFPVTAEDIVDNALDNLDESQARRVTEKAADEIVRLAVEKRKAEYRNSAAQDEMRNLIQNARVLDDTVDDYKISSTFETASGTTNVEIKRGGKSNVMLLAATAIAIAALVIVYLLFAR